jgi:type III secretion system chaperone SycN
MMAPEWLNAVVRDFGRAAGADTFALNDRGAAAVTFETGVGLRFEYPGAELVVAVTVPSPANPVSLRRALSFAHPMAGSGLRIRVGYFTRTGSIVLAVRIAERNVTLPTVNAAFATLWRAAGEIGGVA